MALLNGHEATVRKHVTDRGGASARDDKGRSALMLAASRGHLHICELLLEAGADPFVRDSDGNDALSIARIRGWTSVEDLLRSHLTPNPTVVTTESHTPPLTEVSPSHLTEYSQPYDAPPLTQAIADAPTPRSTEGDYDLSDWEEDKDGPPPPADPSCLPSAVALQQQLSSHTPIETDEDWSDVEIVLPDLFVASRGRQSLINMVENITSIRELLVQALEERVVSEDQIEDCINQFEEVSPEEGERIKANLQVVLGDLGILIETRYLEDDRRQRRDVDPDLYDQEVRDAVTFARSLISPRTDPFNLYVTEIASTPLLSRDEEISLGKLIEEGRKEIYAGIARSKSALAEVMSSAAEIESGEVSLRSMIEVDEPEDEDSDETDGTDETTSAAAEADTAGEKRRAALNSAREKFFSQVAAIRDNSAKPSRANAQRVVAADPLDQIRDLLIDLNLTDRFFRRLLDIAEEDAIEDDARRMLRSGIEKAEQGKVQLVKANLKLVVWVAKKFGKLPLMDRIQEGNIGLMKAADRFDHRRGAKFSTYAAWWIRQAISRAIADTSSTIRIPVHMGESLRKLERFRDEFFLLKGRYPRPEEIADGLAMPLRQVNRITRTPSEPLPVDQSDGDLAAPVDSIEDGLTARPDEAVAQRELRMALTRALSGLPARTERVLRMRFGLGLESDHTLEEVGSSFGVTRERVRQIEDKGLFKLSHPARSRELAAILNVKRSKRKPKLESNGTPETTIRPASQKKEVKKKQKAGPKEERKLMLAKILAKGREGPAAMVADETADQA